ncbi:hypothetical protein V8C86DRAFT_25528 [Haematococcus lacustris]
MVYTPRRPFGSTGHFGRYLVVVALVLLCVASYQLTSVKELNAETRNATAGGQAPDHGAELDDPAAAAKMHSAEQGISKHPPQRPIWWFAPFLDSSSFGAEATQLLLSLVQAGLLQLDKAMISLLQVLPLLGLNATIMMIIIIA